jgi:hypothetical protein
MADGEPGVLLTGGNGEPELRQRDALIHDQALELRHLPQEGLILLVGAEAHDLLDPGTVVPRTVE